MAISDFNKPVLERIWKTPIMKRKLITQKYSEKKLDEITSMMEKLIGEDSKSSNESEIIQQLKETFQSTSERSSQVQILTVLPRFKELNPSLGYQIS